MLNSILRERRRQCLGLEGSSAFPPSRTACGPCGQCYPPPLIHSAPDTGDCIGASGQLEEIFEHICTLIIHLQIDSQNIFINGIAYIRMNKIEL